MRGHLDWSKAERRAAKRPGDQAESEGKRPSDQTYAERDRATYAKGCIFSIIELAAANA